MSALKDGKPLPPKQPPNGFFRFHASARLEHPKITPKDAKVLWEKLKP